jgi:hypothetical protein
VWYFSGFVQKRMDGIILFWLVECSTSGVEQYALSQSCIDQISAYCSENYFLQFSDVDLLCECSIIQIQRFLGQRAIHGRCWIGQ